MNPPHFLLQKPSTGPTLATVPATRRRFRKRWVAYGLLGVMAGGLAVVTLLVAWTFWPGGDVQSVQRALGSAGDRPASTRIGFRVGWPVLMPARCIASLARADEEVLDALRTLRRAEICIRENATPMEKKDWRDAFGAADRALQSRGLDRVVGVSDRDECVGVYVPNDLEPAREIRMTVFVVNRTQTVMVSAVCSTPDLVRLVGRQTGSPCVATKDVSVEPVGVPAKAPAGSPRPGGHHRQGRSREAVASDAEILRRTPLCIGPTIL